MTARIEPAAEAPSTPDGRVPAWTVWLLRAAVLLVVVLGLLQPVSAGMFLTGDTDMLGVHDATAVLVNAAVVLQLVAAVLVWRPGRGPAWPVWLSALLVALSGAQTALGETRVLALHIPLGVLFVGIGFGLVVGAWSPELRVRRSSPRREGAHET